MNKTNKDNPKPKRNLKQKRRRLVSYSLSSLLLMMLVIAIGLSLYSHYVKEREAERTAIEELAPERIYYDFNFSESNEIAWDAKPEGPKWIRDWMKDDLFFARARRVEFFYDDNAEAELSIEIKDLDGIGALKQLQHLRVSSNGLGNVDGISGLQQLRRLQMSGIKANCDLSPIGELRKLKTLLLVTKRGEEVTFSMAKLQNLSSLESASFSTWISSAKLNDIASLKTLPKLEKLIFSGCDFSTDSPATGTGNDTTGNDTVSLRICVK